MTKDDLKKILLMIAGTLAAMMGIIGIFVPVLPTTPFLLLAAYCYARSSQKLYRLLLNNRFFGNFLRNYLEGRGMSLKYKVFTVLSLWLVLGVTVLFATHSNVIRVTLTAVAIGVTIHVLSLRTVSNRSKLVQD
jgi:uncharacterized membrane protein YbaN (DUF454 family)